MNDDRKTPVKNAEEDEKERDFYFNLGMDMSAARSKRRLTQKAVADSLFTSSNTLSLYERGQSKIRAYELKLLCEKTGIEPNALLRYEGKGNSSLDFRIMAKLADMSKQQKEQFLAVLSILYPDD